MLLELDEVLGLLLLEIVWMISWPLILLKPKLLLRWLRRCLSLLVLPLLIDVLLLLSDLYIMNVSGNVYMAQAESRVGIHDWT